MTLEVIQPGTEPAGRELIRVLKELQGLKVTVGAGAGANTNIPVAGIGTDDTLVSVLEVPAATTTLVDRTATSSVTSAGNIQCTVTTAGNQVLVLWFDKGAL